jgi:hypothetical protein
MAGKFKTDTTGGNPNLGSNAKSQAILGALNSSGTIGANTGKNQSVKSLYMNAVYPPVTTDANGKPITLVDAKGKQLTEPVKGSDLIRLAALPQNQAWLDAQRTLGNQGNYGFDAVGKKASQKDISALTTAMVSATSQISGYVQGQPADLNGTLKTAAQNVANSPWLQPTSITRVNIDRPDVQASNKVVNDLFLSLLGRKATDKELQAYGQSYLKYAGSRPTSTETGTINYTEATNPSGNLARMKSSQDYKSVQNNLTEQAYTENQIRNSGEYNAYTAASTAFDLMQKLAASNRAGV